MKRSSVLFVCGLLVFIGLALLQSPGITGAFTGTSAKPTGFVLVLAALFVFVTAHDLEHRVKETVSQELKKGAWRTYSVNPSAELEDINQGYLSMQEHAPRTPMQHRIEQLVNSGRLIEPEFRNRQPTYAEQFDGGHAAAGGRAIAVATHLVRRGDARGNHVVNRLQHFGQLANALYLWIVDDEGNFYLANRQTMLHGMPHMNPEKIDEVHRQHKFPHSTLARGHRIIGSGEVLIESGLVKYFNTASGHYIDRENIGAFNRQGEQVFRYMVKELGWGTASDKLEFKMKHGT